MTKADRRSGFLILLVEDNPADQRLLEEELACAAHPSELFAVHDGQAALDFLHRRHPFADVPTPDLVILDLGLPNVDGWEVLSEVKADPLLKRIPVIILSGSEEPLDVERCLDLHANGYIVKPMDPDGYCDIVDAISRFWFGVATLPSG
jgi:CheY-like chemotaxis protein